MSAADTRDERLAHFVDDAPFEPAAEVALTPAQERFYMASQWKLMWWKLRRHRIAVASGIFLLALYVVAGFAEFFAPYELQHRDRRFIYAPPQSIQLFHEGRFVGPFVYGMRMQRDPETLQPLYKEDPGRIQELRFFCAGGYRGSEYAFWGGLFEGDFHLVCPARGGTLFLLGTDRLGRDMFSRILYGARVSMTIGLIGIVLSFALGIAIGGIAGYYGGWIDNIVQRAIEVLKSFPRLPLWMALSASLPVVWSPIWIFFGITIILAMLDWPGLARAVRSKLLSLREEDFAVAAQLMGARPPRIIGRHLVPSFASHLIASASLAIPEMILGETALSFLGLGLRPPITSWGVLLNEAQNIQAVVLYPWLMAPMVPVILVVLAFNFLGDGLRDAADPYK
ncbi:MAG: ABC transporter permease [Alphaproteobacteria bacterium]|nr:ABC transporter permease [Alphaproteobacteria bacterium]